MSDFIWGERRFFPGGFLQKTGSFRAAVLCEDEHNITKPYVLHAEANAITKVAASSNSSKGATIYVTSAPCIECAKLIIQSGIVRVVYSEKYRTEEGIDLLRRAHIEVDFIDINE